MNPRRPAFTLIELLFAVMTVAILAAILVPNLLEAQVRSKVARVRADYVILAEALEAYYSDCLNYPPNLEPFHPAPGFPQQPVSRIHLRIAPPPPARDMQEVEVLSAAQIQGEMAMMGLMPLPVPPPPRLTAVDLATTSSPFSPGRVPSAAPPLPPQASTTGQPVLVPVPTPMAGPGGLRNLANPFALGESVGPQWMPPPPPGSAYVWDWETSPIARPYLEVYGSADYVYQHFGSRPAPPGGKDVCARLGFNGFALCALTTPVAYLGALPSDPFSDFKNFPYAYFCYSPYSALDTWYLKKTGRSPHYFLNSHGPDTGPTLLDPYVGPFTPYEPTNGTVSAGDMTAFDGVLLRSVPSPPANQATPVASPVR